tara:strand:- start:896 stop:8434 length:7539 start_codon:yes stop_codon:yes gene_type:complete
MPQKTNLNISPYYDDFDKEDNYYKVLFKPGFPVQARELTSLQSILQNQLESFGSHIFKEGSMVIPGAVTYDSTYFSVKVNPDHLGVDVSIYLDALVNNNNGKGTKVRGQNSQVVATIKNYLLPPDEGVEDITLFVKYTESGVTSESTAFPNEEILTLEENITYGNTTLNAGETVLTVLSESATSVGSSAGVDHGVYFVRGTFVNVSKSVVVLEPYSNKPSYRVGLEISETVITANDDSSLNDNAKGFTNYAAPGADRFQITAKLTKKALLDFEDTNFVELIRVRDGEIKKLQDTSVYSEIKKYFAKRTYDESGNYAVNPFRVNIQNSLNDEISSNGLYTENQKTDEGNDPSEDTMCVKLSPGKAYVRGFDVTLPGTTVLDVDKPRDTKTINQALVPFRMGSILKVNNVSNTPWVNIGGSTANVIGLYNRRKDIGATNPGAGPSGAIKIGDARVYSFGLSSAGYIGGSTEWDLAMYDIQTYQILQISNPGADIAVTVPESSRVRGLSSGAIGYVAEYTLGNTTNQSEINVYQTTGTFIEGERLIFNEETKSSNSSVIKVNAYSTEDIKSVYQDSNGLNATLVGDFSADTVLYDKILPNFSIVDSLIVSGAANGNSASATSPRRRFSGQVGVKTDSIVGYSTNMGDQTYNRVVSISADGSSMSLAPVNTIPGVNSGKIIAGLSTSNIFRLKVPKIINLSNSGLYAKLPKTNVSAVNLSNSTLIIHRQVTGKTPSSNTLNIDSSDVFDVASGITSAFFEAYDEERYSIHYNDGTTETLSEDQVVITNSGNNISFNGLSKNSPCTVNVTLKKIGLTTKSKDYVRSSKLDVTRMVGVSTNSGLTANKFYGLRVEDKEISLNVPDVVKIHAIYESKDKSLPSLDRLTFVSGLALDTNTVVGEKIVGKSSRAIGQVVNRVSATEIEFVYLNDNTFAKGESITFKECNITTNLQGITAGNYVNRTSNYNLNKGHKKQYSDYSTIVRKSNSSVPSNRLLVIFDYYKTQSTETGDVFTANSYTKDRYTTDVPNVARDRGTDILDFRPRVKPFNPTLTSGSPFDFNNRVFESITKYVVAPKESSTLGYTYYLPRIDKLVINKFEEVKLIKGVSADNPAPPTELGPSMEVAQITLPPYLYDPVRGPKIKLYDNRRFTMRDIGNLEKRIDNLEVMTSLTALELDTKSLQVNDADGLNRFKTGFVVNDFKDRNFINFNRTQGSRCDVNVANKELISAVDFWSLKADLAFDPSIDDTIVDRSANLKLLDDNCQKTGDLITLKYDEVASEIKNLQATQVENINPFNVIVFAGSVILDPPSDNWTRTIYIDNNRTESTGATWAEQANIVSDTTTVDTDIDVTQEEVTPEDRPGPGWWDGNHVDTTTTTTTTTTHSVETSFTNTIEPLREFDYVESIKISGATDPFMRSRNVAFNGNGLKPFTKHYRYLDSGIPDVFPKVTEIEMISGTFTKYETVIVLRNGKEIGKARVMAPDHKYGDASVIAVPMGEPSGINVLNGSVENYQVDIFDRTRPAPSNGYSSTSKLLNVDVISLANDESYYGYVTEGCSVVGESSGASAIITNASLMADNWGDILGTFFLRNANQTPMPPVLFRTGTKTFKLTATSPGTVTLPGSTALASDATGVYHSTGTILTQQTSTVGVRNPPEPPQRPNETTTTVNVNSTSETVRVEAPYRDPLAQSFRVDETGMFLTSVDVYFASKDPAAKVFVEIRDVELGTPTNFLVQDYAQVSLNPGDITTSIDASIATNIKFPSPVFLEGGKEYAIVFLSPASDLYEMWVSTMGQKTVRTATLPDVESVVHTKQYIGGSLFKSQNGTIWTPSQYQDLTFQLYKAEFVNSGTVTFYNSPVEPGNENTQVLPDNPIRTLPRKLKVKLDPGLDTATDPIVVGRKMSTGAATDPEDGSVTGVIENILGPILVSTQPQIVMGGTGYQYLNQNNSNPDAVTKGSVPLKSLTSDGSGATATLTYDATGKITDITNITAGSGYAVGDVLIPDPAGSEYVRGSGCKFSVVSINTTIDTIILTDVQGSTFKNGANLVHYGANNDQRQVSTGPSKVSGDSELVSDLNTGNVIEVIQYNHAHHGANNAVKLQGIEPDSLSTEITSQFSVSDTLVSVASTSPFINFAGIATDRGDALIESEVVSYVVGTGQLTIVDRGLGGSTAIGHSLGVSIQPYQINGFPLVGINSTINVPSNTTLRNESNIDNYFLEIERGSGPRSENVADNPALLCFTSDKAVGGKAAKVSQNHQFSSLSAQFNAITPGKGTFVNTSVRTISGTSAGGNEVSFIDQGFEPTILNETTFFPTPRLVASKTNESLRLSTLPRNKSLALKIDMTSQDKNLSPVLDSKYASFVLGRNKINSPISDYVTDTKTRSLDEDPHGSLFVSKKVNLKQPASSLRVFVAANARPEADFRVFYRLFTADSSEVAQTYRPFPGYKNLIDTDGDGFGDDIINIGLNDGRADALVKSNGVNDFSEYQFTMNDLEQFDGFVIKIVMTSTNECIPVRLKDFRAIALA